MYLAKSKLHEALILVSVILCFFAISFPGGRLAFVSASADSTRDISPVKTAAAANEAGAEKAKVAAEYGKLPVAFEPNQGQFPANVKFASRSAGSTIYLTATGATMVMAKRSESNKNAVGRSASSVNRADALADQAIAVEMKLKGANARAEIEGTDRLPGTDNYLLGSDPKNWRTGIPTFGRVKYHGVYPGIDLRYYGLNQKIEYDFTIAPHSDPRSIRLSFSGIDKLRVDETGDLVLSTSAGEIRNLKPAIYQLENGERHSVPGRYVIDGKRQAGFEIGDYDHDRPLVIDPIFIYSTFLGGNLFDVGKGIAVDSFGNAYVTGPTASSNFPVTTGALQTTLAVGSDVFVTKMNSTGTSLVYSTFIGGNGDDNSTSIALDGSGNVYFAGVTASTNFPVTSGAYDTTEPASTFQRGFVTKLNSTGSGLVYSTFFGPSGQASQSGTSINGLQVDSFGIAYMTGSVVGALPTTPDAHQSSPGGNQDAFFAKLSADGSALVYSTYLGGTSADAGNAIAIDSSGSAYITGNTASSNFPTTSGAFQRIYNDGQSTLLGFTGDCFVAKYDSSGNLSYSTYLGGSADEAGFGIAVDSSGHAYITGETDSSDFPSTPGALRTSDGGIFKSTDGGAIWNSIRAQTSGVGVLAIAIDPNAPQTLYIGTLGFGVFKSTDSGNNWSPINNGLTNLIVETIAVDPIASNVLYLGTQSRGVFKSVDGGASWNPLDTGAGSSQVTSLAIDPLATGTVYVATLAGLYKTVNGGATWTGLVVPSFLNQAQSVVLDPANHLTVYASLGSVFKSTDGGVDWSQTGLTNGNVQSLALDPSSNIYAADTSLGILRSTDGGINWSATNNGITDLRVLRVAAGSGAVYAGTYNGIFKSTDSGATWALSNTGMVGSSAPVFAIDPITLGNVYAGTGAGDTNAFVTKLNADGTGLVYSTYLGGFGSSGGAAIAVDSLGFAYVSGHTATPNFPVTPGGRPGADFVSGSVVGFVSKVNTSGSGLVYSTLLDAQRNTAANSIAVDSSFNVYVTGQTSDPNFPTTTGAYQPLIPLVETGGLNAFISKIQSSPGLSADLRVTMTQTPTGPITGSVTYYVSVTNNGPDPAYGVIVTDALPSGTLAIACSSACQGSKGVIVDQTMGTLAPGAMEFRSYVASVDCATAVNGSAATNTVTVTSLTPDPSPANNMATVSNTLSISGSISLSPQSARIPAAGTNSATVTVTGPGCGWLASTSVPWISLPIPIDGGGFLNYQLDYSVAANSGPPRTGTISVAGKTFAVIQDGVEGTYGGSLDGAGCNIIAGWAWDQTNPSAAVSVDIYDGSNYVATTAASMYREDLLNVLGSPNHGFALPTPASLRDGATHSITVKVSGTNITIPGSPRSLRCNEASQSLQGFLDGVGCDTISGWAWDAHDPGNIVNVDFYADGQLLGTIAATQYRQDLANVFGQPFHGFTFPTPASLKDGNPHTITVKFGGTNTSLSNSPKSFSCNSSPSYAGSLDPANCTSITGFIWDTNDAVATVNAAIYADGNFLVVVPAQQVSPGVGDGFHGFIFAVPASLKNGKPHMISVKASGTNFTVANSPITLTCP